MSAARVILITVAGPRGHVDIGVRSDATPGDLADALGAVIGVSPAATIIEHRSPPRPGVPEGGRALVGSGAALAETGVADGDLVLFRTTEGGGGYSWPEVQARPAEFGAGSPPPRAPALSSPPAGAPLAPVPAAAALTATRALAQAGTRSDASAPSGTAAATAPPGIAADTAPPGIAADTVPPGTRPDARAPGATRPDVRTAPEPEPDPAQTRPDLRIPAPPEPDPARTRPDLRIPAPPEPDPAQTRPDLRSPASAEPRSTAFDVWTPATGSDVWPTADPPPPEDWTVADSSPPYAQPPAAITQPDIGQSPSDERFETRPELTEPTAGRHARGRTADEPPRQGLDVTRDRQAEMNRPPEQDQAWWHGSQEVTPDDWPG
jgi:hypothetical protein